MLDKIIMYGLLVLSYFAMVECFEKILESKYKINLLNVLLIIAISILNYYSAGDNLLLLKLIISLFSFFLISFCIYKEGYKKSITTSIIFLFIITISEIILMVILEFIKNVNVSYIIEPNSLKSIASFLTIIVTYFLLSIRFIRNIIIKINNMLIKKYEFLRFFIYTVLAILLILMFYILNYLDTNPLILTILFSISCLLIIISSIYSAYKNNSLVLINNLLSNNEESYQKVLENYKMFKHNIMHEFNCIKSLGYKKVNKVIDEYIKEYNDYDYSSNDLNKLPRGISSIFYQKIAENNTSSKIRVDNFLNEDPINYLSTKKYCKLCQGIGIVFDNAIEATKELDIKEIYIYLSENKNELNIKFYNEFKSVIDIDSIGVNKVTSKENHMGLGLKYLYNKSDLMIKTTIRNNKFIIELSVKK